MRRWEYYIITFGNDLREAEGEMDRLGALGWELVWIVQTDRRWSAVFKREIT